MTLDDHLGTLYAGALAAIARADGELSVDETLRLETVLARGTAARLDPETMFFDPVTPASLAQAVLRGDPHRAVGVDGRQLALQLLRDAVEIAGGDALPGQEARTALRFARALGVTADDVRAEVPAFAHWLDELA